MSEANLLIEVDILKVTTSCIAEICKKLDCTKCPLTTVQCLIICEVCQSIEEFMGEVIK